VTDAEHLWPDAPPWHDRGAHAPGGGEFAPLLEAIRLVQDRLAAATPPPEQTVALTERLNALSAELATYNAPERLRWDGQRPDLPGRGSPLLPPYLVDERSPESLSGRITFSRFHLGGNGAAHGGTQPLLFDDLFGWVANQTLKGSGVARTARLTVNYRKVLLIDIEHTFDVRLESVDGRKRYVSGRIHDPGGALVADGDGLFIQLRDGQP
jgi:acyl-coenzyme A thioesterase PaaI-like protein